VGVKRSCAEPHYETEHIAIVDIGHLWGPRLSGWLSWEDLRLRRRVILLAEAYSGKTEEFRHQCEALHRMALGHLHHD
jgi:hypothetical protein